MHKKNNLLLIGFLSLIILAITQDGNKGKLSNSNLRVTQIAGKELFTLKKCVDCHTLANKPEGTLTPVTNKRSDEWFAEHVEKETPIVLREETSKRKQRRVMKTEAAALVDFLYATKPEERKQIDAMQKNVFQGAYFVYKNNCLNCHSIAGYGKDTAPDLTHISKEHDHKWFIENFKNPQQFAPESIMPGFEKLSKETLEKMADYLQTLK